MLIPLNDFIFFFLVTRQVSNLWDGLVDLFWPLFPDLNIQQHDVLIHALFSLHCVYFEEQNVFVKLLNCILDTYQ